MPQRILVDDVDAEVRDLLTTYLRDQGIAVTTVARGDAMRKVLEAGRIAAMASLPRLIPY